MICELPSHHQCSYRFFYADEETAINMVEAIRTTAPVVFGPFYRLAEFVPASNGLGCSAKVLFQWPAMGMEYDKHTSSTLGRRASELYRPKRAP